MQTPATVAGFRDVAADHWAASFIQAVNERGLMEGADGLFRRMTGSPPRRRSPPSCAACSCPTPPRPCRACRRTRGTPPEVSAAAEAGLLDGLTAGFQPNTAITRADTMQLLANALVRRGQALPDEQTAGQALAAFADADRIAADRRAAVALCTQEGLISGYADGTLQPDATITRCEFAKVLTLLPAVRRENNRTTKPYTGAGGALRRPLCALPERLTPPAARPRRARSRRCAAAGTRYSPPRW